MGRQKGMKHLLDKGWQFKKWRYFWRLMGFDTHGSVEMTMIQFQIKVQDLTSEEEVCQVNLTG